MPSTAIACGAILILIGVAGYVYGLTTTRASVTALIPAFFGVALVIFGLLARSKENLRKHLMHAAVVVALLGFLIPAARLVSRASELNYSAAVITQAAMAVTCLLFVILAVRSFIQTRRDRTA